MAEPTLSALVVAHNEEARLADCLDRLKFVDQIVVVLDKCTDGTKAIAEKYTDQILEGSWDIEGPRRNSGIEFCQTDWILEVDCDERVPDALAKEIRQTINTTAFDWHEILVDNYIGDRLVRWGWGASFGKAAYPGLFKKGVKIWGDRRLHPPLKWSGKKGPMLRERMEHYVDRDIADMIRRFNSYTSARALDMREHGEVGTFARHLVRLASRFFKCYVRRKGYKEGGYGFLIALFAGLYPLVSHLKATLEKD